MSQEAEIEDIKVKVRSTGIRVGTQISTKFMAPFITEVSPEGRYILNMDSMLSRIVTAARFVNSIGAENVIVCSGKQYAETPVEKFCEMLGSKKILGRFMPGTLTNPSLPYYIEPKLVLISDPHVDVQAITEATNAGIPVIGIANTDNITSNIDVIIPANNRGRLALAAVYWLLIRQVLIERGNGDRLEYEIDDLETKDAKGEAE